MSNPTPPERQHVKNVSISMTPDMLAAIDEMRWQTRSRSRSALVTQLLRDALKLPREQPACG